MNAMAAKEGARKRESAQPAARERQPQKAERGRSGPGAVLGAGPAFGLVQRTSEDPSATAEHSALPPAAEQEIRSQAGGGPLAGEVRPALESSFSADLSHIRVHQGDSAGTAAESIGARAFAHRNHIWLGQGESQQDLHLMAHEVAHTFQQEGVVRRAKSKATNTGKKNTGKGAKAIKKTKNKKTAVSPAKALRDAKKKVRDLPKTVKLGTLDLPKSKDTLNQGVGTPLKRKAGFQREDVETGSATGIWRRDVGRDGSKTQAEALLKKKMSAAKKFKVTITFQQRQQTYDNDNSLVDYLLIPDFDRNGHPRTFDVDHIKELQLGGEDKIDNMQLLDSSVNRGLGAKIKSRINKSVKDHIHMITGGLINMKQGEVDVLKRKHDLEWSTINWEADGSTPALAWSRKEIKDGDQVKSAAGKMSMQVDEV